MIKQILIYFLFIYLLNYISITLGDNNNNYNINNNNNNINNHIPYNIYHQSNNNNNHNNKISNKFKSLINNHNSNSNSIESIKLWVYFKSKDNSNFHKAKRLISQESINRRLKRANKDSIYDVNDLPVSEEMVAEVLECSNKYNSIIEIKVKSTWLNSISILIKTNSNSNNNNTSTYNGINSINSTINCIVLNENIKSIEIVEKIKLSKSFKIANEEAIKKESNDSHPFYGKLYPYISQIGIDKLHKLGYDGYGIKILMIDTGFWKIHKSFQTMKIIKEHNFINDSDNTTNPYSQDQIKVSDNFHGTAVLSVIGGMQIGELVGPAYNSSYFLGKILDNEELFNSTITCEDAFIAAFEYAEKNGIDLISSSVGGYDDTYYETNSIESPLSIATSILVSKGVVFVNSAGNEGDLNMGVCEPSNHKDTISVGAVDTSGKRTFFSSTGPNSNGIIKPDVMAGGDTIYCADIQNESSYTYYSGTSFSAPLVAGAIALLLQAHPTWKVNQIHNALLNTSSLSNRPNKNMGYGIVNIFDAFNFKQPSSDSLCNIENDSLSSVCSNRGICCNSKCICPEAYYGDQCQYNKIKCGDECNFDYDSNVSNISRCQINLLNYDSFLCVLLNDTKQSTTSNNPFLINYSCDKIKINNSSKLQSSLIKMIIIIITMMIII